MVKSYPGATWEDQLSVMEIYNCECAPGRTESKGSWAGEQGGLDPVSSFQQRGAAHF